MTMSVQKTEGIVDFPGSGVTDVINHLGSNPTSLKE